MHHKQRLPLLFLALAAWLSPVAANTPSGKVGPMALIDTSVGLPSAGFPSVTSSKIGSPEIGEGSTGLTLSGKSQKIDTPPGVALQMFFNYVSGNPPSGSEITQWAESAFAPKAQIVSDAIRSYIAANNLSGGVYTYRQTLEVRNVSRPMQLYWQVAVFADGRHITQAPRLVPAELTYLKFVYVPRKVADGLSSSLAYPDAGKLTYQLVDKNDLPVTSATQVDTAGAYDEPSYSGSGPVPLGCAESNGSVTCATDYGVRCLIKKAYYPDCPSSYPDMVTLINELGANGGILDYSRTLSPVFDEYEDPPGSGTQVQVPRVAVVIDNRSYTRDADVDTHRWMYCPSNGYSYNECAIGFRATYIAQVNRQSKSGCGGNYGFTGDYQRIWVNGGCRADFLVYGTIPSTTGTYAENGNIGYMLRNQTDRYRVSTDGSYMPAGQAITTAASPNEPFSKSSAYASTCVSLQPDLIIDPFATTSIYNWRNDTVNGLPSDRYVSVNGVVCN